MKLFLILSLFVCQSAQAVIYWSQIIPTTNVVGLNDYIIVNTRQPGAVDGQSTRRLLVSDFLTILSLAGGSNGVPLRAGTNIVMYLDMGTNIINAVTDTNAVENLIHDATNSVAGIQQLTGNVTAGPGSGSVVATIANNAVTYAKMQDISATQRALGRKTAGSGDTEECTIAELLDWASATQGVILYRGASAWTALAPSTDGYVLTTHGAAANPTWTGPVPTIYSAYLASDQNITLNTTNAQNISGLSVTLAVGKYHFDCFLSISNVQDVGGADAISYNFDAGTLTVGSTGFKASSFSIQEYLLGMSGLSEVNTQAELMPFGGSGDGQDNHSVHIQGFIDVGGGGSIMPKLQLHYGDNHSDLILVNKGSHIIWTKLQ